MRKAEHVVSFFGHESSRAVYLGLYRIRGAKSVSSTVLNKMTAQKELVRLGMNPALSRPEFMMFDLVETDILSKWKGKLIIVRELRWGQALFTVFAGDAMNRRRQ